jgi:hypothetical protein
MSYIERDEQGEFFNPVSSTVPINPDGCNCDCNNGDSDSKENMERWAWLINDWSKFSFKDKMMLFQPYLHYINTRDSYKKDFDNAMYEDIADASYRLCRSVADIKFDPDGQGIPNILVVLDAIDLSAIPDSSIATSIYNWGVKYGFIENEYHPHDHHHHCCCEDED